MKAGALERDHNFTTMVNTLTKQDRPTPQSARRSPFSPVKTSVRSDSSITSNSADLSKETVRERFRGAVRMTGESCSDFRKRLVEYCLDWYAKEGVGESFQSLHDLIIREQLFNGCGEDVQDYLRRKSISSSFDLVLEADVYLGQKQQSVKNGNLSEEGNMSASNRSSSSNSPDVDRITSMGQAMQIITELRIPVPPRNLSLEKAKLIIKDFISREGGARKDRPRSKPGGDWADRDTTTAALKDDAADRAIMRDLFMQARDYISKLPKPFQNDLEQMFPQHERILKTYIEDLQCSQCVLLVAGEMGSGKSSLVNLLVGFQLMPTSDLRCTSAIVEISYGPYPYAVAHWRDDSSGRAKKPLFLKCETAEASGAFLKDLEVLVTKRDEETDESPFEKIQLYWPIEMLQGGVTIVDSPGVGDSRGLPQILADYMERAFGFIYVIDSTTSIHKHRLGQLLLKAMEANDGFDHNTTLFVCNRWDQVKPEDTQRVKDSLADRLSMILPGVKKSSQLYPISVKQAASSVEYGQLRPDHKDLIAGIRRFLPQTMRGKLRIYYRYLSSIVKRSLYSLRISYNMHKEKVEEIRKSYTNVENRITILQKNAKEKLNTMRQEVKRASIDAGIQAFEYLNSMHQRTKLTRWGDLDCPKREKSWQNILRNANIAIGERFTQEINNWEQENKFVQSVTDEIVKRFKQQFELFDDQLKEVQGALLSGDDMRNFMMEARRDNPVKRGVKPQKMVKGSAGDSYLSIGAAVTSHISLDPKDPRMKKLFRDYDSNPNKVMQEATMIYFSMLDSGSVAMSMGKFFERFLKGIDRVGNLVPQLMKADQDLLENLNVELKSGQQKLSAFPAMSKTCSNIQGSLDLFYVQRLMVTDFTADQIIYGEKLGRGSFADVYKAALKLKTGDIDVAIKEPLDRLKMEDVTDVLLEDNMLRELEHANIVGYYGVCRKGPDHNMRLIFTMEYCPYTLKGKCIDTDNSPSTLGNNPVRQKEAIKNMANYLIQICNGLSYLHQKAIAHRDLKPENVLLTHKGEVRIADFGLAKKVRDIVTCGIGTPVYMAPEILLLNDKYDTKADIYSLGMIMWELWYGKDLAQYATMEVTGGLKASIEKQWRPSLSIVHSPPPVWAELMTKSWDQNPKSRPAAHKIGQKLLQVYQELCR